MPNLPTDLPENFINRELSWLEFNQRVLEEAQDESIPVLERVKFLAIFASNLDEFFMVRVAGLREQVFGALAPQDPPPDGMTPMAILQRCVVRTRELVEQQYACWNDSVKPALDAAGIGLRTEADLTAAQRKTIDKYFRQQVFPVLTPMAIDPSHPSPHFHNRGLYLAATLKRRRGIGPERMFAVVQLPQMTPRLVPVDPGGTTEFLMLEDIVAARLHELFVGYDVVKWGEFRITRDMDIDLLDEEGDDLLRAIEGRLRSRARSEAVRVEASDRLAPDLLDVIVREEEVHRGDPADPSAYGEVYKVDGPLDLSCLMSLPSLTERGDLLNPPFTPRLPNSLAIKGDLFDRISAGDVLLHHPFDSFQPVVEFVTQAARDPQVLAIKQTLYRTSGDSPIVSSLIEAAESGKHVTALVELKARFDEANNISWARRMERSGVHVVYGFMNLKTHCKLCLVVRQEGGKRVRNYAHLGTGNYNPTTARLYTDIGLFTADRAMTEDVSAVFNFLTGYSQHHQWQKLVVAPVDLHDQTIRLIEEQTDRASRGKPARVIAKLNSLADRETIEALYRASQAGVSIDLVIRGICCLRPGIEGLSENIRVRSIVDRFLEHSRILVFGEGSRQKVYLASADWMPRNFERRVEVMFPVEDPELRQRITQEILPIYLNDNERARLLTPSGSYEHAAPGKSGEERRSQLELIDIANGRPSAPVVTDTSTPSKRKPPARKSAAKKTAVTKSLANGASKTPKPRKSDTPK
ncbi:Polyphosphate kinase [Pseudobythopirellula maris]|uniref:Polyphosphate kinase n=1 Tax=Pseudobythopirellula maris TaxID=2527991 RepID=A0A5C5ZME5_9BACT|nr:polyphosphate kinase 1 [Pseudobythopirellula maris]TWT88579.1 Polyphosphate kinase [Pseudobythopirellula maris]